MGKYISRVDGIFKIPFRKNSFSVKDLNKISLYTFSREAIFDILKHNKLKGSDEVILPNYACNVLMDSIIPFDCKMRYYSVDNKLSFDEKDILNNITDKTRVVIIIDFFGKQVQLSDDLYFKLKNEDIIVIKDSAHSFLSLFNSGFMYRNSDYMITSIYKSVSVFAGAICIGKLTKRSLFVNLNVLLRGLIINLIKNTFATFNYTRYINKNCERYNIVDYSNYRRYVKGLNIGKLYIAVLKNINFNKIIRDRQSLINQYYESVNYNNEFQPLFTIEEVGSDILQEFPIACKNIYVRDKLISFFRRSSIDAHTWPTFHVSNTNYEIWSKLLLVPVNSKVLKILKNIYNVQLSEK